MYIELKANNLTTTKLLLQSNKRTEFEEIRLCLTPLINLTYTNLLMLVILNLFKTISSVETIRKCFFLL